MPARRPVGPLSSSRARATRISTCAHCGCAKTVISGDYLRQRRNAAKQSLRDVAQPAKLSVAFLSDVENDRRNASARALTAYVEAGVLTVQEVIALGASLT